jgi:hypothetical protein
LQAGEYERTEEEVNQAYEPARAQSLPVVPGEVVDEVDAAHLNVTAPEWQAISGAQADLTVYHYHPEPGQVRAWLAEAGLEVEEAGTVVGYAHIIAKKVSIIGD